MTIIEGTNIISGLGFTSAENYRNVKQGISGLRHYNGCFDLPEPFVASEIDDSRLDKAFNSQFTINNSQLKYSKFEKAAIVSVADALKNTNVNPSDSRTLFVFSTTKGNVFLLDKNKSQGYEKSQIYLWRSAQIIAEFFGNKNKSVTFSNACISGATAMLVAQRELQAGRYDNVIVVGADMLSKFIVSGFQSFKALSPEPCKPFDANRTGLNIGEAVATVVLSERSEAKDGDFILSAGAIRNDANHISGPSRTGEGSYLALRSTVENVLPDEIAFINAHGTSTLYNDEMESIAITRAGLENVPVNSLKGYFGHTLGAAGILESIISMHALKDGIVLKTQGFETSGITYPLDIVGENRTTSKYRFIKMLSGFGGCNAAVLFTLFNHELHESARIEKIKSEKKNLHDSAKIYVQKYCKINENGAFVNGKEFLKSTQKPLEMNNFLKDVYNHIGIDYRKFFKMDALSKLGFLSSELLLEEFEKEQPKEDFGVLLFNRSASLNADEIYERTIDDKENFFPSPSEFVYTLPNIVTGEISIRNKILGETMFYVSEDFQPETICEIVEDTMLSANLKYAVAGWVDVHNDKYDSRMMLVSKEKSGASIPLTDEELRKLYINN